MVSGMNLRKYKKVWKSIENAFEMNGKYERD
jgi:hypothetical protein